MLDALAAAQSILDRTVYYLAPKGYLRLAPSRIFQRILFAATFLFKALAVGVVEHGQSKVLDLLDQTISVLHANAVDRQHIARGFAALLRRLQAQCKPTLLSRFGVRAGEHVKGENGDAAHAGTPGVSRAPSPHPDAHPSTHATSASSADPALAPTPTAGPSMPPSAKNTPRTGFHPLPPTSGSTFSPAVQAAAAAAAANGAQHYPASTLPYHASPAAAPPFHPATSHAPQHPPWLASSSTIGEPTVEFGGFRLADVPGGGGTGTGTDTWEWDPVSTSLAVGVEQDLLFQSLWGSGAGPTGGPSDFGSGVNPALNLFDTLITMGDGING